MSEHYVTRWKNGAFVTEAKPVWWDAEMDRFWPNGLEEKGAAPTEVYGDWDHHGVRVLALNAPGYAVEFQSVNAGFTVWASTEADLLDLLTTRGPAWLNLGANEAPGAALGRISTTLLGFARHGQGEHIREDGTRNDIDQRRDAVERRRTEKGNPG
jgi:hypothetical protein